MVLEHHILQLILDQSHLSCQKQHALKWPWRLLNQMVLHLFQRPKAKHFKKEKKINIKVERYKKEVGDTDSSLTTIMSSYKLESSIMVEKSFVIQSLT